MTESSEHEDYPRTPDGHIDFEKMLEGLTLEDLDRDGSISIEEVERQLGLESRDD